MFQACFLERVEDMGWVYNDTTREVLNTIAMRSSHLLRWRYEGRLIWSGAFWYCPDYLDPRGQDATALRHRQEGGGLKS